MKQSKPAKPFVFVRRTPEIPASLAAYSAPLFAGRDAVLEEHLLQGADLRGQSASSLRAAGCVIDTVTLAEGSIASLFLKDVRVVDCDLSNLETRGLTLVRVEFVHCRMTGFRAAEADCQDVLFRDCDQRYAQFRFGRFRGAEFDNCNQQEADFSGADLSGARFRQCSLRDAEMDKAKLQNADLRGCDVTGLRLGPNDLRGAVVDAAQALQFAPLLGLRIE